MRKTILLLLLPLFFLSCSRSEVPEANYMYNLNSSRRLIKFNIDTCEWSILCTVENCNHAKEDCEMRYPVMVYSIYDDKVFYITTRYYKEKYQNCIVCYDEKSGRTEILYGTDSMIQKPYYHDDHLYFVTNNNEMKEKSIVRVDVKSGVQKIVGQLDDNMQLLYVTEEKFLLTDGIYGDLYLSDFDLSEYWKIYEKIYALRITDTFICGNTEDGLVKIDWNGKEQYADNQTYDGCVQAADGRIYLQKNSNQEECSIYKIQDDGTIQQVITIDDLYFNIVYADESCIIGKYRNINDTDEKSNMNTSSVVVISLKDKTYQKIE